MRFHPVIQLRPYQSDLIERTRASLKAGHRSTLLVAPCGAGKTVMFSYFCQRVTERKKRVLVLAHRDELLQQISETLDVFKVERGMIRPGLPYDPTPLAHVASVRTVMRKVRSIAPPDIIIIDEAHHAIKGSSWGIVMEAFPHAWKIGVTATPQRLSGEPLDLFDNLIVGPSVQELIDLGALSPYKIFAPAGGFNLTGIHSRAGDYVKAELASIVDKPHITGSAIREYQKFHPGMRAIVFCVSVEHSQRVAAQFEAAGIESASIDGTMSMDIRRDYVSQFREGRIHVLTSCDLVSEGFDLPAIECAIMLRPTQSLALWIQQSGRALRPYPGKKFAVILDHAGNCMRHGLPNEPREWSLRGSETRKKGKPEGPSCKVCSKCYAAQAPAPACVYCGAPFIVTPREIEEREGELEEIRQDMERRDKRRERAAARSLEDLLRIEKSQGYKPGWARHVMAARQARRTK